MTTHIFPLGQRHPPTARNCFGSEVLVPYPALCGHELIGINGIDAEFAEIFTGDLCEPCATAAGLRGQLQLTLETAP